MTTDDRGVFSRRTFVRASVTAAAAAPVVARAEPAPATEVGGTHWLGPDWWGNRLQDWRLRGDRLECVAAPGYRFGRTVSALTWEVVRPTVVLRVRTGTRTVGKGFSGFVVGTGRRGDDWRARVLVGAMSGEGGGFLATYESDGAVRFREHTDEKRQFAYTEIPSLKRRYGGARRTGEDVTLELTVRRRDGLADLLLRAIDTFRGTVLASARMQLLDPRQVLGGVALISSDRTSPGARYWFSDFVAKGVGARRRPQRALGPVVGTLFTVSECGLKMTAQLMPVDPQTVTSGRLQVAAGTGVWETVASASLGPGYTLAFRVPQWDRTRARAYRVLLPGLPDSAYTGTVPAEPSGRELVVAHLSCVKAAHRRLDEASRGTPRLEEESPLGLYTSDNVWFPHNQLAAGMAAHQPDLLVAHGDQLYQNSPTGVDQSNVMLDFLAKYVLWLWSFRELTRCTPTVVLTDDHDVYQPNLWGAGGIPAVDGPTSGGYLLAPDWVNGMQHMVSGHNPDPFDPTPVEQQIGVHYGSFVYGGVSFAFLEDRKFKSAPTTSTTDEAALQLLGARQEAFLAWWAAQQPELPKIVLTQTSLACLETDELGAASHDRDSNGWPGPGRDRALRQVRAAGALVVCGDQHIGVLARHGIGRPLERTAESGFDGPLQFTVPAGSASYQRWFEPGELPGRGEQVHTGEWLDGFDNPVQVLAIVQPSITRAHYRTGYLAGSELGDRNLKREGYGIVRVNAAERRFVLECWPWHADPLSGDATQYAGFPYAGDFDDNLTSAPDPSTEPPAAGPDTGF